MNDCRTTQRDLADYLSGETDRAGRERIASHLATCPECREQAAGMRKVLEASALVKDELDQAVASVDWEVLPGQIADYVLSRESRLPRVSPAGRFRNWIVRAPLKPAYAGLGLGLVLGILGTWLVLQKPAAVGERAEGYFASPQFLERAEVEVARRETVDYLERSRFVLLDFVQNTGETGSERNALTGERARELLTRKKYINSHLEGGRMAAAKAICDQIEILFLELSQITRDMPDSELSKIQDTIRESRLLFKINLAKKELESEV
jgi:hypothetical protein